MVCPAPAGMSPAAPTVATPPAGLPRTRGDEPLGTTQPYCPATSAPHPRG